MLGAMVHQDISLSSTVQSPFIAMSHLHDKHSLSTLRQSGCSVVKRCVAEAVWLGCEIADILSLKKKVDAKKSWKRSGIKES